MKKARIIAGLLCLLMGCTLTSCDEISPLKIIDWAPVELYMSVNDADGNNLLEGDTSWLEGMSITFNGQTSELDFSPMTRAYMPEFMGFRLMDSDAYGQKVLYYGELEGGRDYDNEEFVISWPDGTQDVITYSRKLNRRKGDATQSWSLNGTKLEGERICIALHK